MGLGESLSLLCAFLWALAVICYHRAGAHLGAYQMSLFKIALVMVMMLPTTWLAHGLDWPDLDARQWALALCSGAVGIMLADLLYLRALQLIGAGLTGLTASLYSPFVVGLSMLLLGERLNTGQIFGMALVLAGVLLVSYRKAGMLAHQNPPLSGFFLAALSVFFTALGIVIIKPLTGEMPFFWLITLRTVGGLAAVLLLGVILRKSLNPLTSLRSPGRYWLLAGAFLGQYLSTMVWVGGFKYTSASVASILNETASIFILLLSWLILKESLTGRKLLGAAITVTGVYLVIRLQSG